MPHKFNAARRHKFDKAQYRVINWAEYNESVRQRGDLTIWVSDEAQSAWSAPRRTSRGGQRRYSDLAIETCLTLRTAYRLGLRQTQGLMGSIGTLMGLDIRVPDYSTLSRRANGLSIAQAVRQAGSVPVHLVVDSTGLQDLGRISAFHAAAGDPAIMAWSLIPDRPAGRWAGLPAGREEI